MKRYYIQHTLPTGDTKEFLFFSGQELLKGLRIKNLVKKYKKDQVNLFYIAEDDQHHEIEILTKADTRINTPGEFSKLRATKMSGIRYNGQVERWPTLEGKRHSFYSLFGMSKGKELHVIDVDQEARLQALINFLQ